MSSWQIFLWQQTLEQNIVLCQHDLMLVMWPRGFTSSLHDVMLNRTCYVSGVTLVSCQLDIKNAPFGWEAFLNVAFWTVCRRTILSLIWTYVELHKSAKKQFRNVCFRSAVQYDLMLDLLLRQDWAVLIFWGSFDLVVPFFWSQTCSRVPVCYTTPTLHLSLGCFRFTGWVVGVRS